MKQRSKRNYIADDKVNEVNIIGLFNIKSLNFLLIIILIINISGCLFRPDVDPKQLSVPPNTFSVGNFAIEKKKVYVVEVSEYINSGMKTVWKIESKEGVPAKDFRITLGEITNGFVQTIPADSNERFQLIRGREYNIMIWDDYWPSDVSPRGATWIAE